MGKNRDLGNLVSGDGGGSGSGVTVYTGLSGTDGTPANATYLLNASSPSAGDLAYVSSNTSLYQNNGNGWYRIAVINTTPTISTVADASSNTSPFDLQGGTDTVITVTAADADEGTDLTYTHSVTTGSLNGTTVTQGTGASENVFTITPHSSNATTFSITFTVSDNINAATSVADFTLSFTSWANATQQAQLQHSNAIAEDRFGRSVSLSEDGNTAIVGAWLDNSTATYAGAAYVFTRSGTSWSHQQRLEASDVQGSDSFGQSVSISNDGNTAIVGANLEDANGTDAGAAYIYTRSGTSWSEQQKIVSTDIAGNDHFGWAASISGDGNTVIVGARQESAGGSQAGAAYFFTRSGTTWTQQQKILAANAGASDQFGHSVSIDNDADTAIIGAPYEDTTASNAGAAYVFTRSGTSWTQQALLQSTDIEASDFFGGSVAISSDGNTAVVGANKEDTGGSDAGSVYVFTRSGTTWTQQQKLQASDVDAGDEFGTAVSISDDGNTVMVGSPREDTTANIAGSMYFFTRSGTSWTQQKKIQASNAGQGDRCGAAVAISGDGETAIAGTEFEDTTATNAGSAYIFVQG